MSTASERKRRDRAIERLHRAGRDERAIGKQYGLHPTRVRTILVDRGLIERAEGRDTDGIWGKDDDARRAAFRRRELMGAREALRLMEGSST